MLSRVQAEDVLSLARARIDSADMLAALHFPNRGYNSVFLDGVIGNFLGSGWCCALIRFSGAGGLGADFGGGCLVCIDRCLSTRIVANCGLVLGHNSVVLLFKNSNS